MNWLEIIVSTNQIGSELLPEILAPYGIEGCSVLDKSYIPDISKPGTQWELYDKALLDNMPEETEVHAWIALDEQTSDKLQSIEKALEELKNSEIDFGTLAISSKTSDESDWKDIWKKYYKPIKIGKRLVIKPSWEDYKANKDEIIIELDPGMAFGTGGHATSNMCLKMIDKYCKENTSLIDIGTGSGILAIAAAKLKAKDICAIDISEDAVLVAKENIEKNGVADNIELIHGNLVEKIYKKYDIAVANIIADAIILLSKDIKKVLKDKALFICSGILYEREKDIVECMEKIGFKLIDSDKKDEWVALCFKRIDNE